MNRLWLAALAALTVALGLLPFVANDYVVATGESHSVAEFLEEAFSYAGLDWRNHVEIDERYFRPTEVDVLLGDPSKAKRQLGWQAKTSFTELVHLMVHADMATENSKHSRR